MEFRNYQSDIIKTVMDSDKDTLICLPTGAGKTVVAFGLIQEFKNYGVPVVFVVPRLELIKQANETFGEEVDFVWSDKTKLTGNLCIIASKDSLRTQASKIPPNCVYIFDEAHIGIEQTKKIIDKVKPIRVLGLTATPERMDGLALLKGNDALHKYGCFDNLLQAETVPSLINKGYLCELRYYTKPIEGISDIKPDEANGQELSEQQMIDIFDKNQIWGDLVDSYEKYGVYEDGRRRPALGFTNTVAMAESVASIFQEAGYDFRVISGEMSVSIREELISKLSNGEIDGLVNAALLTYGFDCPPVSYAFSCRHIKSRPLWFQIVGRILRPLEGKPDAVFIDHGDSVSEFEEPTCSLPILDPLIEWKVDGETKEERFARKKNQKKTRDTLKLIQELDPQPCDMVEVKPEDTWERMIKVLQKLRKEKDGLFKMLQEAQKQSEIIKIENQKLKTEIENTKHRVIDSEQTFEFVRKNYCYYRKQIHESLLNDSEWLKSSPERKFEIEHTQTCLKLRAREKYLSFLLDERTFNRGLNYWKTHFCY